MATGISPTQQNDDDSEWEYEYSTTETETYYVTLDISKADFVTRQQASVRNGRGGYKEEALEGVFSRKNDDRMPRPGGANANGDVNEEGTEQHDELSQSKAKNADEPDGPDEVQILELHSAHPIVSYRGRIYEGQWSRNVGTELLLAQRDEDSPLPAVRQLERGVDLLAASSTRIMLTEKSLKPVAANLKPRRRKVAVNDDDDDDDYEGDEGAAYWAVPEPEQGASQDRYDQGNFLRKLIALKQQKGETDEVAVIAKLPDGMARRSAPKNGRARAKQTRGNGRGARRARGRGRGRGRGGVRSGGLGPADSISSGSMSGVDDTTDEDNSRPTPHKWIEVDTETTAMEADDDDQSDNSEVEGQSRNSRKGSGGSEQNSEEESSNEEEESADKMDVDAD
ncbi:hypothetical protein BJ170DRAFT_591550 [Xylariales sp. AK1849]|nr:hypothetical protein BJ170DRAFT_591550 [Xylariales sp. AK1849]